MQHQHAQARHAAEPPARSRGAPGMAPATGVRPWMQHLVGTALLSDTAASDEPDPRTTGPVWRQVATDAEGRRRFHGAFTGGFSAGYFNTVGSKEGWTPTAFVSSRVQRAGVQQRPEDFMDDEDYADVMVGGKAVKMKAEFKSFETEREASAVQQKQPVAPAVGGGNIPGFLPSDLIAPSNSPIGIKLLRLMGWREGQGVGPRRERRARKKSSAPKESTNEGTTPSDQQTALPKKVYGLAISLDELRAQPNQDDDSEDFEDSLTQGDLMHTLPPADTETVVFDVKANFCGLGYDPYVAAPELRGRRRDRVSGEPLAKGRTIGALLSGTTQGYAGFGLGAFEDADDHDHQLYAADNVQEYDHELHDNLRDKTDPARLGGKLTEDDGGRAGRGALRIFRQSSQKLTPSKWYPPPEVPKDYRPFHYFTTTLYTDDTPGRKMNADSRGEILGETPLPTPHMPRTEHKGSVFDLVSSADKERLSALKSRFEKSESETEAMSQGATYHRFANEPAKQMRFRNFLLLQSGQPAPPLPAHYDTLTEWERQKEKEEFIKIANEFKKVPDVMASRFQSAGQLDLSGAGDGDGKEAATTHEGSSQEAIAAAMKMFGRLTRTEEDWFPESLLCKRFNLRQPHPDRKRPTSQVAPLMSALDTLFSPTALALPSLPADSNMPTANESEPVKEEQQEGADEQLPTPLVEPDRPSVDIFKAIFEPESDTESEAEEDDNEIQEPSHGLPTTKADASSHPSSPLTTVPDTAQLPSQPSPPPARTTEAELIGPARPPTAEEISLHQQKEAVRSPERKRARAEAEEEEQADRKKKHKKDRDERKREKKKRKKEKRKEKRRSRDRSPRR